MNQNPLFPQSFKDDESFSKAKITTYENLLPSEIVSSHLQSSPSTGVSTAGAEEIAAREMFVSSANIGDVASASAWGDILMGIYRASVNLTAATQLKEEIEMVKAGNWKGD